MWKLKSSNIPLEKIILYNLKRWEIKLDVQIIKLIDR
tara:strand:- start:3715 stop:3825 length:111 start_codon:yes stop_codon:yes gene_type:complete